MPEDLGDDLAYMSIGQLGAALRARELSPVELVDAAFTRIERRNPSLNAFVYENREYGRDAALGAEKALAAGDDASPLLGIPTAIKDLADSLPGWTGTLGGIRALRQHTIDSYCNFGLRLENAGAIALGKTNSPTFGFRGTCDNLLFGPTRNPFDLSKNSGGSSGGAAAAVADGLVPFAEGTDGGGSIRIPAAWTNTFGFKGTSGRVARLARPVAFGASTLFTFEGCITRSVEDTVLVMEALAGYDSRDPYSLPGTLDWRSALQGSVAGRRIAYTPDLGVFPVDGRVRAVVEEAAKAFEAAGALVDEVSIRMQHTALELGDLWCRLMVPSSVVQVARLRRQGIDLLDEHRADLPPELLYWMEQADRQSIADRASDAEMRTSVYDAVEDVFDRYDLLLTPTLSCPPVDNASDGNTLGPESINGVPINRLIGWCPTFIFNFTGHPAASAPAGLIDGKWPAGIQIAGKRYADLDVLTAAACYEAVRPWHQHYRLCRERPMS